MPELIKNLGLVWFKPPPPSFSCSWCLGKTVGLLSLGMILPVGFSKNPLSCYKVTFNSYFIQYFYHQKVLNFVKYLFCIHWVNNFFLYSSNGVYYIDWLLHVQGPYPYCSLWSWQLAQRDWAAIFKATAKLGNGKWQHNVKHHGVLLPNFAAIFSLTILLIVVSF